MSADECPRCEGVGEYVVVSNRGRFYRDAQGKRRQIPPDVTWHYCDCPAGQLLRRHDDELEERFTQAVDPADMAGWTEDLMKLLRRQHQEWKQTVLHRECAWCGKDLGQADGEGVEGISHGCCPECAQKFFGDEAIAEALAEKEERSG